MNYCDTYMFSNFFSTIVFSTVNISTPTSLLIVPNSNPIISSINLKQAYALSDIQQLETLTHQ